MSAPLPIASPRRLLAPVRFLAEMLLPYGIAVTSAGTEILFNRAYRPLWRRLPGQAAEPAGPNDLGEKYRIASYVYEEPYERPARNAAVKQRCLAVLAEWGVPAPTAADVPAAWERHQDAFAPHR